MFSFFYDGVMDIDCAEHADAGFQAVAQACRERDPTGGGHLVQRVHVVGLRFFGYDLVVISSLLQKLLPQQQQAAR